MLVPAWRLGVLACVALVVSLQAGCGNSGVQRYRLSGMVTYDGKPVPAGQLRFEPNVSKGGKGPIGFAQIRDGAFDTDDQGKGPVVGPMRVLVRGYVSAKDFAPELFPQHTMELDISSSDRDMTIEVPVKKRGQAKR